MLVLGVAISFLLVSFGSYCLRVYLILLRTYNSFLGYLFRGFLDTVPREFEVSLRTFCGFQVGKGVFVSNLIQTIKSFSPG